MRKFTIIPEPIPVVTPGEIDVRAFANVSLFGSIKFLADQTISMPPPFRNNSVLNPIEVTEIDPIILPALVNASTFPGGITVSEAPADGVIDMPALVNVSTFPGITVSEAPADGVIRVTILTNVSTFNAIVVAPDETEDDFGPIGFSPIGGSPV